MAQITAALVKELRDITGAGMMECKKALTEAEGDIEKAIDVLRTRGLAAVTKKAGRATNEGTVIALVAEDGKSGVAIELNCETDFVGINEKFKAYANRIAKAALAAKAADVEAAKAAVDNGETVEEIITDAIHVLGENIQLSRVIYVEGDAIAAYIHSNGKIGVLVIFDAEGVDAAGADFVACGKDVAMQVAAMNPVAATRASVPAETVEHEMAIYKAQAAESGKPANIQEKMALGRMEKFYKEQCLTEQIFVKNNEQTVNQYVQACAKAMGAKLAVRDFIRMQLGA